MKIIHTMLRVTNLEKSIEFYKDKLGMFINKHTDYENGKFTLVFLGYGPIESHPQIELTYNWDIDSYKSGDAFGHIALGVKDIYELCDKLKKDGVKVTREPGPMKFGGSTIAFIEDPDGYKIELIQE